LDGRLFAARDFDFKKFVRIIELEGSVNGFDLNLSRTGGNNNGDARQMFAHRRKLRAILLSAKGKLQLDAMAATDDQLGTKLN